MRTYFVTLFILSAGICFSQQKDTLKKYTPRFIVKMTHGMTSRNEFDFTNAEWAGMTPGFTVPDSLNLIFSGGNGGNVRSFSSDSYYMFSFSFINGKNKQVGRKFLSTTNIHLGYGPEVTAGRVWSDEYSQVIDTLTSSQNGQEYYVVGNRVQTISKAYRSRTIAFGIGQHIATNPDRIFQFETGVDVLCLLSIASELQASYTDEYLIEGIPNNGFQYEYPQPVTQEARTENFSGIFTAGLIMRVPLEMSFKLSKKNPVISRMRIGWELNPGLAMQFTKGKTSNNFSVSGGMNFRFAF